MPSFLFWNINNLDAVDALTDIVTNHDVDVLMLTECPAPITTVLSRLNAHAGDTFHYAPPITRSRPQVFVKYSSDFVQPLFDSEHITIRRFQFPAKQEILLVVVHLPSPLHMDERDRSKKASEVCQMIESCEATAGHDRTVVVGDFNMDPFSDGLISADAFNAVGVRKIAERGSRMVSFRSYSMFFNPMWNMFSDGVDDCPGTYFHNPSGYQSLHHRIFDQVLIRPSIMNWLKAERLFFIKQCGARRLVNDDHIPTVSDHLPIAFNLEY